MKPIFRMNLNELIIKIRYNFWSQYIIKFCITHSKTNNQLLKELTDIKSWSIVIQVTSSFNANLTNNNAEWLFTFHKNKNISESYFHISSGFGDEQIIAQRVNKLWNLLWLHMIPYLVFQIKIIGYDD